MTNDDGSLMLSAYVVPDNDELHPQHYYDKLVKLDDHMHLYEGEAEVDFLLVAEEIVFGSKQVLGMVHMPTVQGKLKGVFTWMLLNTFGRIPDFLVLLDKDYWRGEGDLAREILMFHEMCHMVHKEDRDGEPRYDESGRPVFGLVGHDVEEFSKTVARYGAYSPEIREFIAAAESGGDGCE